MSDRDVTSYFIASIPLALAHLCIPPVSSLALIPELPPEPLQPLFKFLYDIAPPVMQDSNFVYSLMLLQKGSKKLQNVDHRLFTHLFVHATYGHMLGNLAQCVLNGYPVFRHFGPTGFYLLFLSGGIFGSINAQLLFSNWLSTFKSDKNPAPASLFGIKLPTIRGIVNTLTSAIGIEPTFLCCGSSGAVFTLYGSSMVLSVRNLVRDVLLLSRYKQDRGKAGKILLRILRDLPFYLSFIMVVSKELMGAEQQQQIQSDFFSWISATSVTGHTSHLDGMLFGMGITALSLIPGVLSH
ncbi:rhomboid family intramembrane serine protease [archaeon]|nr:MAG: rhomboid family intramembrane serine protease [archaeon]